jgi:hypothetical protein
MAKAKETTEGGDATEKGAEIQSFSDKLLAVYKKISYIQKTGHNKAQNYSFLRSSDVIMAVNEALRESRLLLKSVDYDVISAQPVQQAAVDSQKNLIFSPKGDQVVKFQNLVTLKVNIEICDADGASSVRATGIGQGIDPTDKASAKAMTIALKYALTSAFLIATGDDPEADESADKDASAGDYQRGRAAAPAAQASTGASATGKTCSADAAHGNMKLIPSGIYKDGHAKAGQTYNAFYACQVKGCSGRAFADKPKTTPVPAQPAPAPAPKKQAEPPKGGDDDTPF